MNNKKIIIIVLVAVGLLGIFLGIKALSKKDNSGIETPNNSKKLVNEYVGYYGIVLKMPDGEDATYTENLYLKNDSTFVLDVNSYGVAYHPSAGTYAINDNEIILTETVRYGSDTCYFKDELSTYKVTIKDKNTLTVNLNDRIVDFTRNTGKAEDEKTKNYYVANPKGEGYKDCTGQG